MPRTNSSRPKARSASKKKTNAVKSSNSETTTKPLAGFRFKKRESISPKDVNKEIKILIFACISVLMFLSILGMGGVTGKLIANLCFGLIGLLSYVIPFLLFFAFCFYIANKEHVLAKRKLLGFALLLVFLCVILQLLSTGYDDSIKAYEYFIISSKEKTGGGFIGGGLMRLFALLFGVPGAYVVTFIGILISAIVMTQRPLIRQAKERSRNAYQKVKTASVIKKNNKSNGSGFHIEHLDLSNDFFNKKSKEPEVPLFIDRGDASASYEKETAATVTNVTDVKVIQEEKPFVQTLEPVASDADAMRQEEAVSEKRVRNPKSSKEEIENNIASIKSEIKTEPSPKKKVYKFPPLRLLNQGAYKRGDSDAHLRETAMKLQQTLHTFGVEVTVTNASCGPTVTRYELQPEQGVKVSKIVSLADDIKLNLAATDIRIEAPIPGKAAIGIEVPNKENSAVMLRELLQSEAFVHSKANLSFAVGKDLAGKAVVADIARMPHLLIAGATGSGKSVCINTLIMSLLYKANPDDVKLILIDPKVVELSVYNGIPHLMIPVVTDPKKAAGALNWAVAEMTDRYNKFAEYNVRDLKSYNDKIALINSDPSMPESDKPSKIPQIVIIVDELADLMMVAPGEVEDAICRLAQLARAAGIHLIIATQRPSVNVITGLIKANMPSRIAFSVTSGVDSRTILDMNGAEKLLGKGDMLYYPQGYPKPARLQGALVTEEEVARVVKHLSSQQGEVTYSSEIQDKISAAGGSAANGSPSSERDTYFADAGKFIIEKDKASIGMLQRVFKIGFNRAARIMDQLCEAGVVGEEEGTKPRKVLMSMEEFEQYIDEYV